MAQSFVGAQFWKTFLCQPVEIFSCPEMWQEYSFANPGKLQSKGRWECPDRKMPPPLTLHGPDLTAQARREQDPDLPTVIHPRGCAEELQPLVPTWS